MASKGQISGTIIITECDDKAKPQKVTIYTRVSASENRPNLYSQVKRLTNDCIAKGWQIHKIVKEVGSGVNDNRQQLHKLLANESFTVIVVEHKDRLTRFGFNYMQTLMEGQGRRYGLRRARHITEKITQELRPCN